MNTQSLIQLFNSMADAIEDNRNYLCELDGVIGDADHGITMSLGFSAVREALVATDSSTATPTDIFNIAAKAFLNAVGASAGPLYATAFMRAGASVKGKSELDTTTMAEAVVAMAEGIATRGKASVGDKTMLDAWIPAAEAAKAAIANESTSIGDTMQKVATAARQGADSTVDLLAKKGRAAKLGERSIGHMDAGAESTAILLRAMADGVSDS